MWWSITSANVGNTWIQIPALSLISSSTSSFAKQRLLTPTSPGYCEDWIKFQHGNPSTGAGIKNSTKMVSISTRATVLPSPRSLGCLAMSGGIFNCYDLGESRFWHLWLEAKVATKHSTIHSTAKNYLPCNANNAKVEKSCFHVIKLSKLGGNEIC